MKVGQNRYYLICYVRVRARIWSAIRGKKKRRGTLEKNLESLREKT